MSLILNPEFLEEYHNLLVDRNSIREDDDQVTVLSLAELQELARSWIGGVING